MPNCERCGAEFIRTKNRGRRDAARFCSRSCGHAYQSEHYAALRVARLNAREAERQRNCANCGAGYIGRPSSLYCGLPCQSQAYQKRAQGTKAARACHECGSLFAPAYGEKRRNFCSDECGYRNQKRIRRKLERARLRNAKVESVDPVRVFDRDGWRCHLCHRKTPRANRGTLKANAPELDHIVPLSKGGEHSYANTACACRRCNSDKSDTILGQPSLLAA